jgi:L-ascorbate metabolism protein UlaG (beta-lactamase superfamily)
VEISWLGHAAFRLRSRDVTVVTDPYSAEGWDLPALRTAADFVTVSHDAPHHGWLEGLTSTPRAIKRPGEYELHNVMIKGVRTRRKAESGQLTLANTAFLLTLEDVTICHLGDLGEPLTTDQQEALQGCDVLCIPVGGHCTIDANQAVAVISQLEPRVVIPMHYGTEETAALGLDTVDRFCREMGATSVTPQARLNVSQSSLPTEPTVVLLDRRS